MSKSKPVKYENIDYYHTISQNIAYFRRCLGYTQAQLSEKINISQTYLATIESTNNTTVGSLEVLFDIANALGIEPYQLLKPLSNDLF